ncbi:MAG: copper chaperone PCu(A)C [Arenimonas sp.]
MAPAASKAPAAPCAPTLEAAWIRAAPPGTTMLAGYAQLHNACATTLTVVGAQSTDFASVSLHATLDRGGVSHMQEAGPLEVAPGASLELAPGGTHLMLMGPAQDMHEGATGRIDLVFADGRRASADFVVRRDAPVSP